MSGFINFLRFCLFIHERHNERGKDTGRGRSRLQKQKPGEGLDPGTPESGPGPKAGAQPMSQPGIPEMSGFMFATMFLIQGHSMGSLVA